MTALYIVLGSLLALALLYLLLLMSRTRRPEAEALIRTPFAHRGLHGEGVPENSLAAFRAAVEAGVGIELDVQLSSDGVLMVFHDDTLIRMTGKEGKVSDYTCAALKETRLGESEETVPTFAEVLETVGGRVPLLVEVKYHNRIAETCEKTAALLDAYEGAYLMESFHPLAVRWFAKHRPTVVRGQLSSAVCKQKLTFSNFIVDSMMLNILSRPDFIAYSVKNKKHFPFLLAKLWKPYTVAWTVRTAEELLAAKGFDQIIFEGISADAAKAAFGKKETV